MLSEHLEIIENWSLWNIITSAHSSTIDRIKRSIDELIGFNWIMTLLRLSEDWKNPIKLYRNIRSSIIEEHIKKMTKDEVYNALWKILSIKRNVNQKIIDNLEYIEKLLLSIHKIKI